MSASGWIGKFAQVKNAETPGWGPEGLVSYPEGIGGFIVRLDDEGRAVLQLSHFYGEPNDNLAAYGEVAFQAEDLLVGDGVQAWGKDDRGPIESSS
ncbi:MAG: hypothetical protein ACE5JI_01755 [Acidobacteriota bacterium]